MAIHTCRPDRFRAYHDCLDAADPDRSPVVSTYILVKLAARCNLACTYCYWFRDQEVYAVPKRLTLEAEEAFVRRLAEHVVRHGVRDFFILFHGGEPMLFGRARFAALCRKLRTLEAELGFSLKLSMTTNGLLIDAEWAALFATHRIGITLSIDGPRSVHDRRRVGFDGRGSFDGVIGGLIRLREAGVEPGFLSVCDPAADPRDLLRFFADDLGAPRVDVLVPDATHDDDPPSIAAFYIGLFDAWYDTYLDRGLRVRLLETLVLGLLGEESRVESIGYGPNTTSTLTTDGSIEPLDVLRVAGDAFTRTRISVFDHSLQQIQADPLWRDVLRSSLTLPEPCRTCRYRDTCGGGHIGQRWSSARRFDNPSVYCADIMRILDHIWHRLSRDLTVAMPRAASIDRAIVLGEGS